MAEKAEHKKSKRRAPVKQTDIPSVDLEQALRIPKAITDNYASKPTTPLNVAAALEMQPTSGPFKMLCGAAIAYGLTNGGYNASQIEVTPLATRIVRPKKEGDDLVAKREAILKPRILSEFLNQYHNSPLPKDAIAINVLEEMGVPRERAEDAFEQIQLTAESVGLLKNIKKRKYVDIAGVVLDEVIDDKGAVAEDDRSEETLDQRDSETQEEDYSSVDTDTVAKVPELEARKKRVFITHGKNKSFLEPIKKLLSFGEMESVISVDKQSVSKPVPDKVMADMRGCGAAIIHVDADRVLMDADAIEHIILNENVLIEIGCCNGTIRAPLHIIGKRRSSTAI
jgi:hypothetical protein